MRSDRYMILTRRASLARTHRLLAATALAFLSPFAVVACAGNGPSDIASAKHRIESCAGTPPNSYIGIDGTGSGRDDRLDSPRIRALEGELVRVAACGTTAKVTVFSSSSGSTVTLFEGSIQLVGATDQAKARRLGKAVQKVVDQITGSFDDAVATLDKGGSDVVAQLRLASEWSGQLKDGAPLRALLITDGFQNKSVTTKEIAADPQTAAARFEVPDLSNASVVIAGVGQVGGAAPPTKVVDAVKSFYLLLCERTGATSCRVVTEIAGSTS